MLSTFEKEEIQKEILRSRNKRSVCVEALRIINKQRGWVSDEAIKDIGTLLDMSPEEVDGVATFYDAIYRKPVGKHIILVCDSVSCWIMGREEILHYLQQKLKIRLGQTTPDGNFTLLPTVCLGACDRAPVMMIDDVLYGNLTKERIDEIFAKYLK
jgi:NADH-quinone oxidoreductase subunit E